MSIFSKINAKRDDAIYRFYYNRLIKQVKKNNENYFSVPDFASIEKKERVINAILVTLICVLTLGLALPFFFIIFYTDIFVRNEVLSRQYALRSLVFFANLSVTTGTQVATIQGEMMSFPNGLRLSTYGGFVNNELSFCLTNLCVRDKQAIRIYQDLINKAELGVKVKKI